MIDPLNEDMSPWPQRPNPSPSAGPANAHTSTCLYRWTTSGCRGVVLESVQVGATRCTSREAMARFFARLSRAAGTAPRPAANGEAA